PAFGPAVSNSVPVENEAAVAHRQLSLQQVQGSSLPPEQLFKSFYPPERERQEAGAPTTSFDTLRSAAERGSDQFEVLLHEANQASGIGGGGNKKKSPTFGTIFTKEEHIGAVIEPHQFAQHPLANEAIRERIQSNSAAALSAVLREQRPMASMPLSERMRSRSRSGSAGPVRGGMPDFPPQAGGAPQVVHNKPWSPAGRASSPTSGGKGKGGTPQRSCSPSQQRLRISSP
ncbi:unnamed protein product, partial [Amoebophrya sp. A25]